MSPTKKRTILAVTGSRAEYGLLFPVLEAIYRSPSLLLSLAVTGIHLLPEYGYTIKDIEGDGFCFNSVPMYSSSDDSLSARSLAFAEGVRGFTQLMTQNRPDFVLVLGDRIEPFAAVVASAILAIPIAHIHGGDTSDCGQIDDSIRHSITRFANIHFAASRSSARRLEKMGEMPWRIFNVGSPGIDSILQQETVPRDILFQELGLDPKKPTVLCLQHSVTLEKEDAKLQMTETMAAICELGFQTVVIYPNNDPGSHDIISVIKEFSVVSNVKVMKNIEHRKFVSLMKFSNVMIGNSSSGVTETASFRLPSVSIGTRQRGREHAENVLFVDHKKNEIIEAIRKALDDEVFRRTLEHCQNPYGDGRASEKIVEVLERTSIDLEMMRKLIAY